MKRKRTNRLFNRTRITSSILCSTRLHFLETSSSSKISWKFTKSWANFCFCDESKFWELSLKTSFNKSGNSSAHSTILQHPCSSALLSIVLGIFWKILFIDCTSSFTQKVTPKYTIVSNICNKICFEMNYHLT